jgi:cell division septation protein DedD
MSNMSNDFTPDADDQMPEKKSSQQLLLLLLLLLVVLFVYLYFFTGLIKPRGEEPKPQPVAEAPVKKPLPPRPNVAKGAEPAKPAAAKPADKAEEHKIAAPAVPPAPAAKPGVVAKAAPAAKPSPAAKDVAAAKNGAGAKEAPAAKSAAPPAKSAIPAGQAKAAKPAGTAAQAKGAQPAVAPVAKATGTAEKKAATTEKKAAAAEKKTAQKPAATVKTAAKEAAGEKTAAGEQAAVAAPKKTKVAAKPAVAAYTLEINGDLAESELGPVMAKLKQAGITHVVKSKQIKGEPMHRLFLADFANRDEALEELERLKLATADAFLLKENGRFAVYAGSYLREAKANSEQSRLQAKGVQLLLKSATAPVSVLRVRAGAFANQAGAERAVKALKKSGLSLKIVKLAQAAK